MFAYIMYMCARDSIIYVLLCNNLYILETKVYNLLYTQV